MPEKTEAQKRAQKNYMEKFAVARIRMDKTKYDQLQDAASKAEESVNTYVLKAIDMRMENDNG